MCNLGEPLAGTAPVLNSRIAVGPYGLCLRGLILVPQVVACSVGKSDKRA